MGILKKNRDYMCIGLSDETLKMAHFKVTPQAKEVLNVAKRDIRGIPQEELPKIVRSVVSDFKIRKCNVIGIIPSNVTTTKNIEIPSVDPQEIRSIINLQAGRHTPYSREEIIIDYVNIGTFQRNYSKVLLIIINRNIIKKQINVLESAGLGVEKILFVPENIARFYSKVLNLGSSDVPVGVIDISNYYTDFTIGFHSTVIACRNIPLGMKQLAEEGAVARDKLIGELKKSIESYQSEDIEKLPESYILTNDNNENKELQTILSTELKTNVKIVPYLDNLKFSQAAKELIASSSAESFLDVTTPLIVLDEAQMDFTPEEIKLRKTIEAQGREVAKLGVLSGIILILICLVFFSKIYFKSSALANLKAGHQKEEKEAKALEKVASKTRIVKDYLGSRLVSLEVLNELYRILPDEIYLNSVTLDEKGDIIIQGTSESMSLVFSLVSSLEDSPVFKGVKTTSTTAKKERSKDVAAFELSLKLESAKDKPESETGSEKTTNEKAEGEKAATGNTKK